MLRGMNMPRPTSRLPLLIALLSAPTGLWAMETPRITLDGRLDEAAWAEAQRFDQFRITEPFTQASPDPALATVAYLLATPEGIVVGMRMQQPAEVPLLAPRVARDERVTADRVNFYIDFEGDGRVAFNFAVLASGSIQDHTITNEVVFNPDLDPDWQQAVHRGEGEWSVEMLIPWTTTAMRDTGAATRTVAVHFDRVIASRNERQGWPAISFQRGRFVSEFARIEIPQYRASLLHFWPYATVIHDRIDGQTRWKTGADLFWKPSGHFQLMAALNPDFGQVEADDLVVNFEAVEVFFSDKRPFFTENQAFFDLRTPDQGQLVYTRRIGGPGDDGSGVSDIDLALKANGSLQSLGYGVFGARESGDAGRSFGVGRLLWNARPDLGVGWLNTRVDRPFLGRESTVQAADLRWTPAAGWLVNGQWITSRIDQRDSRHSGQGGWTRINWSPSTTWRWELEATHFGRGLDFNDLGFMRRGSLNELELLGEYQRQSGRADGLIASTRWEGELQVRSSDRGVRLPTWLALNQASTFHNGDVLALRLIPRSSGYDDLVSRGNGLLRHSSRADVSIAWMPARTGRLGWDFHVVGRPEGLSRALAWESDLQVYWFPNDRLNFTLEVEPMWSPDWLIWKEGRRFARHSRRLDATSFSANWFPAPRHEIRIKTEWLAVRARDGQRLHLGENARLTAIAGAEPDFDINSFGFQLRYRWEFAAQSDFWLVWSRGGFLREEREGESTLDLLDEALALRDADQLLAKLRYRF